MGPGFAPKVEEPRYFCRWLEKWEYGWKSGNRWELRILGAPDCPTATVEFGPHDSFEAIQEQIPLVIPAAVIEAARSGCGGYVSSNGKFAETTGGD